jgi:hypothetical protein
LFVDYATCYCAEFLDEFGIQENMKIEVTALRSDSFSPIKDGEKINEEDQKGF